MRKKILPFLLMLFIYSCNVEEQNKEDKELVELDPIIEFTIEPTDEILPYDSDITINWAITNATSATLGSNPINLTGSNIYSNLKQTTNFTIKATNIIKTSTITKTVNIGEKPTAPLYFDVVFSKTFAYFSTSGYTENPTNKLYTQSNTEFIEKIDMTYAYTNGVPGFLEPITRSIEVYGWENIHEPWLEDGIETIYYTATHLNKEDFDIAQIDELKINEYFSNPEMKVAGRGVTFPVGTDIGGTNNSYPPFNPSAINKSKIFGFKNIVSEKKGLIYIHDKQNAYWPSTLISTNTRVLIIREK